MRRQPPLLFVTIALTVFVCASSIWLVPVGHGPFPAAYGPMSPLWARRAALRLLFSIGAICAVMMDFVPTGLFSAGWQKQFVHLALPNQNLTGPSLVCVLRC